MDFTERIKTIPLKTRLEVANQMAFIDLLTKLGYREDKSWGDDEQDILLKLNESAKDHADWILAQIEKWEKDGKPQ